MLEVYPYALTSARRLNAARSEPVVRGCLVRCEGGVACLQPWPEFGDPSLDALLADFRGEGRLAISRQARVCCEADANARRAGTHLLAGRTVPESHYTLPWGSPRVPEAFRAAKVKAGPDCEALQRCLRALPPAIRLRLDFNESLDAGQFRALWRGLAPFHPRIDFVEDPVPYHKPTWQRLEAELGCRLAVDRCEENAPFLRVWKPARRCLEDAAEVVVTSNMDHPIGQVYAAYRAATLPLEVSVAGCGLVTHHLFDPADPFVAAMGDPRPDFPRLSGTGLGFDELLDTLPWQRC